ncbi:hypothetical protein [Rhizobium leguminosarum]|uniref:hypothetical protein n=1 Tax=Rhizobium leguminosarum TaxID=384 RepID=UPI001031331A|nr:hypothetical protein [Rhizobium leguminosarum]TAV74715.1 hypothetical protein ELI28_14805 [Rhizobium leguminosarum]TAV79314.1 hypothetical protein ELI27_14795 [Rhizobium leguminosarum]
MSRTKIKVDDSWEEITEKLKSSVMKNIRLHAPPVPATGIRHFLHWVCDSHHPDSASFRKYLADNDREGDSYRSRETVYAAIKAWCAETEATGLSGNTMRSYRQNALACLEQVGQDPTSRFPAVSTKAVRYTTPYKIKGRPSIAALDWIELAEVPLAQRDAAGLKLVRATAIEIFEIEEKFFHFGRAILSEPPTTRDIHYTLKMALRLIVASEQASWTKYNTSQFSQRWTENIHQAYSSIGTFENWRELGFPIASDKTGAMSHLEFGSHVLKCIGPSLIALHAAQIIFCCDNGWNKQPIQDLGSVPFVFQTENEIRIGSQRVLQSFKTRADHFVFANGDTGRILRGLHEADAVSTWDQVVTSLACADFDETAVLATDGDLYDLMTRFSKMTGPLRSLKDPLAETHFFIAVTIRYRGGLTNKVNDVKALLGESLLARDLFGFAAIRKSFIVAMGKAGRQNDEIRAAVGQHSTGHLESTYRADAVATKEFEDAIRFFQGCVQALSVDGTTAVKIGLSDDDAAWFKLLARESGIESACGLSRTQSADEVDPDFVFVPNDENLADLYLADRALKSQKRSISYTRWQAQGMPLSALLLAIYREILKKGFKQLYKNVARRTKARLTAGRITLPAVLQV